MNPLSQTSEIKVSAMSAGWEQRRFLRTFRAAILAAAVPLPPLTMAPACPMRRPGGAVAPAIKAAMGFLQFSFAQAAASSSAVPPISPIIIIGLGIRILVEHLKHVQM